MDRIKQPVVVHSTNNFDKLARISAGPERFCSRRYAPPGWPRLARSPEGESNALCVSMLPELPHEQSSTPARTPIA